MNMAENRNNLSTDMNLTLEEFVKFLSPEQRERILEMAECNLSDVPYISGDIIEIERNYSLAVDIIEKVIKDDE
jgi:hypothetical protein